MPQKLVTLKNGKSRTGGWRHSLYNSLPSFDEKDLYTFIRTQCLTNSCFCVICQIMAVMSCEKERGQYAQQRYMIQFLHKPGKNCVETLHAIQATYWEEAVSRTTIEH